MVKFNTEQAVAFTAIQELINEWGRDLDLCNGEHISDLVTGDCSYAVANPPLQGRDAVKKFYADRVTRLSALPGGVPDQRHLISNLCVTFAGAGEASITFTLLYFTTAASQTLPDAAAVADVRMACRREADEHWRIARFESNQPFRRG